ncbi:MAG: ATP-binding protein [Nocardioidaceae bacterium]
MSAIWVQSPARYHRRFIVGVRVFGACAVLLLAGSYPSPTAFTFALAVCGLAGAMGLIGVASEVAPRALALVESLFTGLIVTAAIDSFPQSLIYLLVPTFIAGIAGGLISAAEACLIQIFALVALTAASSGSVLIGERLSLSAAWLLASIGSGLLGAWIKEMESARPREDDAYDSARRLLGQLRTVARRLSAGLDPVGIGQQILAEVKESLDDTRSVLLVRSEGGVLVPLTFRGEDDLTALSSDDPLVADCWASESPVQQPVYRGHDKLIRTGLPLQVGLRMVGVLVADCVGSPSQSSLTHLRNSLAHHSLRLDTALLFDEVRTLATADERRRLAREIHDGIAQEVASIGYVVDELIATSDEEQREGLQHLRNELTRLTSELRLSIFDLRSEITPDAGLTAALSDYVRQVGSRSGMTVHLSLNETPHRLRVETETEVLRIAQEAITNARRHSGANNLWVTYRADPPHAELIVTDDGHGLGKPRSDSYGMRIMRERADRIGGRLDISTRPEGGTTVTLVLQSDSFASPGPARHVPPADVRKEGADDYVGTAHR